MVKHSDAVPLGFKEVEYNKLISVSAGTGIASQVSSIASAVTSGISGLVNVADDISDTIIKNKIIAKIDEVSKGEVELGKEGQIRLKWDNTLSTGKLSGSNIIF